MSAERPTSGPQPVAERGRHGVLLGLLVGAVLGALVGAGVGSIGFDAGSPAMWGAVLGGIIFGAGVGAFAGGLSRLDSPPPGQEAGEDEEPLGRPGFTRDENEGEAGA